MWKISGKELVGDRPVQRLVMGEWRMRGFLFAPTWSRTLPANLAGVRSAVAALGLVVALTFPSHAQAPNLGTDLPSFAVLGASTVTNTNPSVLTGNLGVSPGTAITGFPPGIYSCLLYTSP